MFDFKDIFTCSLILFAVIDVLGSIPVLVDIKSKVGTIQSGKATLTSGIIMILFLFLGEKLLTLIGIDVPSFAIAGSIVIFILALELVLGVNIFKEDSFTPESASIVPIAFPILAGAGTLTTILSLRAEFANPNILMAILLNLAVVFAVLKFVPLIERVLGPGGINVLRRIFGVVLLAIAIKLFKANI